MLGQQQRHLLAGLHMPMPDWSCQRVRQREPLSALRRQLETVARVMKNKIQHAAGIAREP